MGTNIGKDFGSMNMVELLKSIWNPEETQTNINNNTAVNNGVVEGGGMMQRQGSLTLPRTALGEMTLEEFLVNAGVVREENQLVDKPNDNGLFCNLTNSQNTQNKPVFGAVGFQQGVSRNNHNLPLNVNGVRSAQSQQQSQQKSQQLFPKQTNVAYGGGMKGSPVIRNGLMGVSDGVLQGGNMGLVGPRVTTVGSPAVSSDGMGKNNGDTSSVSPSPHEFSGIVRGRKSGAVEKVVERRQRRMIKNRESAAGRGLVSRFVSV
ncbi:putative plant bZIP transcription factor [Helianthus annuus]|uniref:Basic-leucine zipper domain-containing protein n=2 Tax=Helianthus annuus TaxID=4232 RepID=A0A9K3IXN3_HELAN|nr:hypothetical protein HanXRQr2_Chr05g0200611 [Helianthus annuus]KAJ0569305.1 putative plant bZIP transcription factor [Helianthus annuus]KAJ0583616.1 putative plant bZIP transcription factor [Helianthus annuus]KAJ0788483.1 putative plant bZIP transcription factor [Helianthus annuus]KAJ0917809.1 putative plant bZIP transcription factor [Helianthus annuus]